MIVIRWRKWSIRWRRESCSCVKRLFVGFQFSSVHFSRSVVSDSLRPGESQYARPPCPSPTPEVHSDSRPLSQWCHPAISSSVVPFSSCPLSLQHQSLFQCVNSSHEVAKALEFQLQHHSFQRSPRADLLQNGLVGSPWSPSVKVKTIKILRENIGENFSCLELGKDLLLRTQKDEEEKKRNWWIRLHPI